MAKANAGYFSRGLRSSSLAEWSNQAGPLRAFNDAKIPFCAGSERLKRFFVRFAFIGSKRFFITFKFHNDGPLL
jgi:hypothetical protein